jgi:hypothetical protein
MIFTQQVDWIISKQLLKHKLDKKSGRLLLFEPLSVKI